MTKVKKKTGKNMNQRRYFLEYFGYSRYAFDEEWSSTRRIRRKKSGKRERVDKYSWREKEREKRGEIEANNPRTSGKEVKRKGKQREIIFFSHSISISVICWCL